MSDLKRLQALFGTLGIPFTTERRKASGFRMAPENAHEVIAVDIDEGFGYPCFWCEFDFDPETGKFLGHGVWE